ncbi:medium-chain acyl-CoA ligase ACSF2, mitochondrial-like [Physella acuta]|uniref:medium-chain acyl-CoA ligase ACSF2, mitochondrial-like n=1 Tax=Physella acuta TaxID=109671 RepID=UPI0027DB1425|nr:medium-chain acyl-CoA ligase ACSF2, mitochondrial-like [Physella acuta]
MAMYGSSDMGYCVIGLITSDMKQTVKDCYTGDRLAGNTKMKIVDEKTHMEVTCPNQLGKLFFKGGTILRHYLDFDSSLSGVFKDDGWFDSTDVGYIDEKGGVHVIGRTSDVIVCGPVIVYPQWLEDRIIKCPGVAGVIVVGIHHPVRFQELCVCVVREKSSTLTEEELRTFCKEIFIDNPNCDDEIPKKFFFMDSFPLTSTGKTWRKEVERLATEHFHR